MTSNISNVRESISYKCDICTRTIKLIDVQQGIGYLSRCSITQGCTGIMHPILNKTEKKLAKSIPPSISGVQDWSPRRVLYDYTQPFASREWTIQHNLDSFPNVIAYNKLNQQILPDRVIDIDQNTVRVIFKDAQIGIAQCIATSSKRIQETNDVETLPSVTQITNSSTITIATVDDEPIDVLMTFEDPITGEITSIDYTDIETQLSVESPWVASRQVVISNRYYYVRSFNLRHDPNTTAILNSGKLGAGVSVSIDTGATKLHEHLILLTNPPFTSFDRITDKYVDLYISDDSITFNKGELLISDTSKSIRSVYPPITSAIKQYKD